MQRPIGIIDSGVGGLSVFEEVTRLLPHESVVYLADSAHCPYGTKTPEEITQLSLQLVKTISQHNIKLLVVACNTITVTALDVLRNSFPSLPIIGTVPVVKNAASLTQKKRIGILSTLATAHSLYQKHLIEEFAKELKVINRGTDKLVPLIEQGIITGETITKILKDVLAPFKQEDIDVLALGCTHFPFLRKEIEKELGTQVMLLDSGAAIARQVKRVLAHNSEVSTKKAQYLFLTTANAQEFTQVIKTLLGKDVSAEHSDLLSY
ncbi:MAG TPA: glutamate racemase [Patescibacteria group bacterium]|nr:glutamate racemase [Patescibacteria group bacterium]